MALLPHNLLREEEVHPLDTNKGFSLIKRQDPRLLIHRRFLEHRRPKVNQGLLNPRQLRQGLCSRRRRVNPRTQLLKLRRQDIDPPLHQLLCFPTMAPPLQLQNLLVQGLLARCSIIIVHDPYLDHPEAQAKRPP